MKSTQFPDWPAGLGKIATKYVNSCYLVSPCVLTVLSLSASKPYLVIFQTKNELPSGSDMMPGQAREFLNSETKTTGLRNEADCQVMERKKCPVLDSAEARKNTDNSPSLLRKKSKERSRCSHWTKTETPACGRDVHVSNVLRRQLQRVYKPPSRAARPDVLPNLCNRLFSELPEQPPVVSDLTRGDDGARGGFWSSKILLE